MNGKIYIRRYKELTPRMLWCLYYNFTFDLPGSGMRAAIRSSRCLYSFVAFKGRKIIGWALVYKGYYSSADIDSLYGNGYHSAVVFISPENRHQGLGDRLRRLAMRWAMDQDLKTVWYDAKNNWRSFMVVK